MDGWKKPSDNNGIYTLTSDFMNFALCNTAHTSSLERELSSRPGRRPEDPAVHIHCVYGVMVNSVYTQNIIHHVMHSELSPFLTDLMCQMKALARHCHFHFPLHLSTHTHPSYVPQVTVMAIGSSEHDDKASVQ